MHVRKIIKKIPVLSHLTQRLGLLDSRRERWMKETYVPFAMGNRQAVYLAASRFFVTNRPIEGYYFEFGCNEANTMRLAWDSFQHLHKFTYVGFDSFEGLPEIQDVDKQAIWAKGKLAFAEDAFIQTVTAHGMPRSKLITVKGFYDVSLNEATRQKFLPAKAAMIYIDCDLYHSTVPILKWIKAFLQPGTIIAFDDWQCFLADPNKGQQRAWREFLEANPTLHFEEFYSLNEPKSFVFIEDKAGEKS